MPPAALDGSIDAPAVPLLTMTLPPTPPIAGVLVPGSPPAPPAPTTGAAAVPAPPALDPAESHSTTSQRPSPLHSRRRPPAQIDPGVPGTHVSGSADSASACMLTETSRSSTAQP